MANSLNLATLVTLAVAAALLGHTTAVTHIVGGASGWTFAGSNPTLYTSFASQNNFIVGDTLVFNFTTSIHNVAIVNKTSYDGCIKSGPIAFYATGPASITLNETGETYFICLVGQHCATAAMKLAINVTASSSPTTPSSPSPSGNGTTTAPPPSAASRTDLISIVTIFISAAIGLLF